MEAFSDPRLKYSRSDKRLPMHENWEAALSQATGDYITFIGDDDALMPFCLDRVKDVLATSSVDLLAWTAHTYYWPDVPDTKRRNHLTMDARSPFLWKQSIPAESARDRDDLQPGVLALNSKHILTNWLDHSGFRLYVPTYHNLVSRTVINRVKATTGAYFFNPLPDIATLIANLYVTDEVLFYASPLSMTGHSGRSSGGCHGHQEAWDARLHNFVEESGSVLEQLAPTPFKPFLWNPALLAGCFEDVKRRLFPDNQDYTIDWHGFLISAAAQVKGEPEAVRLQCVDWLFDCADRLSVPRSKLLFKAVQPWAREHGTLYDPEGRAVFSYIDGDALGWSSIADAVKIAHELQPTKYYKM